MKATMYAVPEGPGLTLDEAFMLYQGRLSVDELDEKKRECVAGDTEDSPTEIVLKADAVYELTAEGIEITRPLTITGRHATLCGHGKAGFCILSGNVLLKDFTMQGFEVNVEIDGRDAIIEHIHLKNIRFTHLCGCAVQTGTTKSRGGIRDLLIENCRFENNDEQESGNVTAGYASIAMNAASCRDERDLEDVVLEDVCVRDCVFRGSSRETVNVMGGTCGGMFSGSIAHCKRTAMKNLKFLNNDFEGSYDATINVITGFMHNDGGSCDGLEIAGNRIVFGLWGIFVIAGEPVVNTVEEVHIKNIRIHDNHLVMRALGCGEPSCGIAVNGGRLDFYTAVCRNCGVDGVHIFNNYIEGSHRGISVDGGHSLLDGDPPSEVSGCYVQDILIEGNEMKDVGEPFRFFGTYMEGRRYDWKIGIPPADIEWQKPVEDHSRLTYAARGNLIKDLRCVNNSINGFSYMLRASGALARGHGLIKDNTVSGLVFEGNEFTGGENHLQAADVLAEDWVRDEGGNHIDVKGIKP